MNSQRDLCGRGGPLGLHKEDVGIATRCMIEKVLSDMGYGRMQWREKMDIVDEIMTKNKPCYNGSTATTQNVYCTVAANVAVRGGDVNLGIMQDSSRMFGLIVCPPVGAV